MINVMQADTGGGGYANKIGILEIDKFLDKGEKFSDEELDRIKNTDNLNASILSQKIKDTLDTIDEDIKSIQTNNAVVEDLLQKSNSTLLDKGKKPDEKKAELQNIIQVLTKVKTVLENMDPETVAREYNDKLKTVQNGAKLQLLHREADRINGYADSKNPMFVYKTGEGSRAYDAGDVGVKEDDAYGKGLCATFEVPTGQETKKMNEGTAEEYTQTYYNFKIYYVAYCNYWWASKWGKGDGPHWYNPFTWGDDNIDELEQKIRKLAEKFPGISMPY